MLTLKELKSYHDKAYQNGYDTRLKSADDMLFAFITQWDDTYLQILADNLLLHGSGK